MDQPFGSAMLNGVIVQIFLWICLVIRVLFVSSRNGVPNAR
jgi:hypothetical protein